MISNEMIEEWKEHAVTRQLFKKLSQLIDYEISIMRQPGVLHTQYYDRMCAAANGTISTLRCILNVDQEMLSDEPPKVCEETLELFPDDAEEE